MLSFLMGGLNRVVVCMIGGLVCDTVVLEIGGRIVGGWVEDIGGRVLVSSETENYLHFM